jgi:hypothetical protein
MSSIDKTAKALKIEVFSDTDPAVVKAALQTWLTAAGERKVVSVQATATDTVHTLWVIYAD